jgi:hypothetical protein
MAFEIVWTEKAIETYAANIEYLRVDWSEREIRHFSFLTMRKLEILKNFHIQEYLRASTVRIYAAPFCIKEFSSFIE